MFTAVAVLLSASADALRTAHPLLSNEAARTYRAAAANHFAQIMPLVKPSLLAGSENKTEDRAAGKALLKRMDRAAQTPECMTPIARRGYVRTAQLCATETPYAGLTPSCVGASGRAVVELL